MLVRRDALPEAVRVHVCEPEDDRGDRNQRGDPAGRVRVRLRSRNENCEHDDRAVDEPAEPLAHCRAAEPRGWGTMFFFDHGVMIRFHRALRKERGFHLQGGL